MKVVKFRVYTVMVKMFEGKQVAMATGQVLVTCFFGTKSSRNIPWGMCYWLVFTWPPN